MMKDLLHVPMNVNAQMFVEKLRPTSLTGWLCLFAKLTSEMHWVVWPLSVVDTFHLPLKSMAMLNEIAKKYVKHLVFDDALIIYN